MAVCMVAVPKCRIIPSRPERRLSWKYLHGGRGMCIAGSRTALCAFCRSRVPTPLFDKIQSGKPRENHLRVPGLLVRVDVPDDVIRQSVYSVACSLGHLGEAFCLGLVLEGIAWKIDTCFWGLASVRIIPGSQVVPDRWTSALTRILTPPMPSSSISSSLFCVQ